MNQQHLRRAGSRRIIRSAALLAAVCASMFAFATQPAQADTAPPLACGNTQPGPCTETAHFTNQEGLQTPVGAASGKTNCPDWVLTDYPVLDFTGHGIEHNTLNKAQDFWSTSTFNGTGTVTFYPASSVANIVTDDQGNIVSYDIVGPPDATVTGHLADWFGVSANKQSAVIHNTINFTGTDSAGTSFALHDAGHASWTPGTVPFQDAPHLAFNKATC
jgi:hypothetical protein